jgi:hypothetical protein
VLEIRNSCFVLFNLTDAQTLQTYTIFSCLLNMNAIKAENGDLVLCKSFHTHVTSDDILGIMDDIMQRRNIDCKSYQKLQ